MHSFTFKAEFDDRSIELIPNYVHPLGPSEIRALETSDAAPITIELEGNDALIDGKEQPGLAKVKAGVIFNKPTIIYALVRGGWVPMPFAIPSRFLVDRNVVISLRRIREGKVVANADSLQWWTAFFSQGSAFFNPLPYAFEAGFRRKPTLAEFISAYDDGVAELAGALPACNVVRFSDTNYKAAYAQLEAFDQRNENEVAFLQATCPLISQRISRRHESEVADAIVHAADEHKINRASLVSLAVLSCLFEDVHGEPSAIGRQVLKPKLVYSEGDAFNSLSDLRHIEMAAAGQAYFKDEAFSLCTCDRPLALLWSALSLHVESPIVGSLELTFDLTEDLFSRLTEVELHQLKQLVSA